LTVFAEDGLGPQEVAALTAIRDLELPAGGDRTLKLRVQLIGLGTREMFQGHVDLFRSAKVWQSATPFVVHRHLKWNGTKRDTPHLAGLDLRTEFAELAVRELIARRQLGSLVDVKPQVELPGQVRPVEFERRRGRSEDDGDRRPFGTFRLTFAAPIHGPLCLGYACHYCLGLFRSDLKDADQ
jgi:CRISPR-associated protein Csb2